MELVSHLIPVPCMTLKTLLVSNHACIARLQFYSYNQEPLLFSVQSGVGHHIDELAN